MAGSPHEIAAACFTANCTYTGGWGNTTCSFTSMNGQVWWQRTNQYLLANGIAVMQVNTAVSDNWDWWTPAGWATGLDRPFLRALFGQLRSGTFDGLGNGVLDGAKLLPSGYSVGSQMVSWLIELHATGELARDLAGAKVVAGAMFAGGPYAITI